MGQSDSTDVNQLPSSAYALPASIRVEGNKLILTPQAGFQFNTNYTVVLMPGIKSTSGKVLLEPQTINFSSEFAPLYTSPTAVRQILRTFADNFSLQEIYVAIRDAGYKAQNLTGRFSDPNDPRFRPILSMYVEYFPATRFCAYEAARTLLSSLLLKMLEDPMLVDIGTNVQVSLGDFRVAESSNTDAFQAVEEMLSQIDRELVYWRDALMGRTKRGYAKPQSAQFRTASGSPTSRDF
ncbi:Ig-like domain-containing protein [Alicyclobacillus shizuokensis]|uniref:Ig-like domain-containing protein n=1 Tax=Alicyclobacillus shizuokensis TaxID=392014 RepID=UPI000831946D|nr:Ig-like domain-containing protein [Alicyclobacillus shizuokensis]